MQHLPESLLPLGRSRKTARDQRRTARWYSRYIRAERRNDLVPIYAQTRNPARCASLKSYRLPALTCRLPIALSEEARPGEESSSCSCVESAVITEALVHPPQGWCSKLHTSSCAIACTCRRGCRPFGNHVPQCPMHAEGADSYLA